MAARACLSAQRKQCMLCQSLVIKYLRLFPFSFSLFNSIGEMLSINAVSAWNNPRFLTINLENSRVPRLPSLTGCTNGDHNLEHVVRKLTMSRVAPLPKESQTALQKCDQSHISSSSLSISEMLRVTVSSVKSGKIVKGAREMIAIESARS